MPQKKARTLPLVHDDWREGGTSEEPRALRSVYSTVRLKVVSVMLELDNQIRCLEMRSEMLRTHLRPLNRGFYS